MSYFSPRLSKMSQKKQEVNLFNFANFFFIYSCVYLHYRLDSPAETVLTL